VNQRETTYSERTSLVEDLCGISQEIGAILEAEVVEYK
jgi:hypothetical protein